MSELILKIQDISLAYEECPVVTNLSLDVKRGELLCIVGESGSGKSTLLRAVCGDESVQVTEGSILYEDCDIVRMKEAERQKLKGTRIGYIQQNPYGAFNPLRTIEVQFRETLKSHGKTFSRTELEELFGILELNNIDEILKSRPYELSGGMNQRIAIAASFILRPELLLCDEITSALDVTTAAAVMEELLKLKSENGTTIVLVTHNIGQASNIADRIAIMYQGKIVEFGESEKVLMQPEHEYTKKLLRDVPRL